MASVPLRIALLKQADVHCQLATAQETPEGDPNKAVEHYLTAMELLTCAVADMFQLADVRKAAPSGCRQPAPQQQRPPAFASPLSEVHLQSIVQHKLRQYEERVQLLLEVIGEPITTTTIVEPTAAYNYHQKTAAPLPPPTPPTQVQQHRQQQSSSPEPQVSKPITTIERAIIEASNPWNFGNAKESVPEPPAKPASSGSEVQFPSPPSDVADTVNPRQAPDTEEDPQPNMDSVNRRFGQEKVADADEAFEDIFNQFLTRKEEEGRKPENPEN